MGLLRRWDRLPASETLQSCRNTDARQPDPIPSIPAFGAIFPRGEVGELSGRKGRLIRTG